MQSTKTLVIILVVALVGVFGLYIFSSKPDVMEKTAVSNDSMEASDVMEKTTDTEMSAEKTGSYEAYSPEKIAMASTGKVVLFFRASWCPTCRALDENIKSNLQAIPEGVTILDVNYDNSSDLKQKYGVTYQHTLVQVDASGNQIAKWSGSPTLEKLLSEIK